VHLGFTHSYAYTFLISLLLHAACMQMLGNNIRAQNHTCICHMSGKRSQVKWEYSLTLQHTVLLSCSCDLSVVLGISSTVSQN
jgi:hypothetical protein